MPEWLINFFAGLGILETVLLFTGGIIIVVAIKNADKWEWGGKMLTEEQKYLIRELNSFNYLHFKLIDMTDTYAKSLSYFEDRIARIDEELTEYHVPSLKYDRVAISSVPATKNTRVIELITDQERMIKQMHEKKKIQEKEVEKIVSRIDDINKMLKKLDQWEIEYITNMYIRPKGIDFMMDNYNYSKATVFRKATYLLKKMLKK